jgi:uncharacterized membrane protein
VGKPAELVRGWFYSSKSDTRLWVPKRPLTGSGYTPNFAQPGVKVAVAAMATPVLAVVVLLLVLILNK